MQGLLMVDGGRAIECLLAKLKVGLWVGGHWRHGRRWWHKGSHDG